MKTALKWGGLVLGLLVVAVVAAVGFVQSESEARINATFDVQPEPVGYATDATTMARGKYLFTARACAECHGDDGAGKVVIDDEGFFVAGSNITPGGVAKNYTDVDWVRAIRHGVKPDGKPLFFMPSHEMWHFSDEEVGAIIAYAKTLTPSSKPSQGWQAGTFIRALFVAGQVPALAAELIDHEAPRPAPVEVSDTVEYGAYIAKLCMGCHGHDYAGGKIPGGPPDWPPAQNLTPAKADGVASWTTEQFMATLRTGKRPDGTEIDPSMPFGAIGQMNDLELTALHKFLQQLPAVARQ